MLFAPLSHFRVTASSKKLRPADLSANPPANGGFPDDVHLEQVSTLGARVEEQRMERLSMATAAVGVERQRADRAEAMLQDLLAGGADGGGGGAAAQAELQAAQEEVRAARDAARVAERRAARAEQQAAAAGQQAAAAGQRASTAEQRADRAEQQIGAAEQQAVASAQRAERAQHQAAEAERTAQRAVGERDEMRGHVRKSHFPFLLRQGCEPGFCRRWSG